MISVQSLLQPLSGSKIFLLVFLMAFTSCGIFKEQKRNKKPQRPHKPIEDTRPEDKDTITINDDLIVDIPPMEDVDLYEKYGSEFKSNYKIALILPLKGKNYIDNLNDFKKDIGHRFINYYGGTLLALDDLENDKIGFDIEVINSSVKGNDPYKIMRELNKHDLDVIIGPYERKLLKEISKYGKRKNIPVISPWQSSSKLATENPNYIQLKPDITKYYQAIVEDVDKEFIPQQVYLLGREFNKQERARIEYFLDYHKENSIESFSNTEYNSYFVEEDSLNFGKTAFDSLFEDQLYREIAVIIPNWSFKDEQYIYSCVRKLNAEKQLLQVHVYGMPIIVDSDKIGYNLYKNLDMSIAMESFLDKEDPKVIDFRKRYFKRYHAIPTSDALQGYDVMSLVGKNMMVHGNKFQYFLAGILQEYLQYSFSIEAAISAENLAKEKYDEIEYFQNMHIDILDFDYNAFKKKK